MTPALPLCQLAGAHVQHARWKAEVSQEQHDRLKTAFPNVQQQNAALMNALCCTAGLTGP